MTTNTATCVSDLSPVMPGELYDEDYADYAMNQEDYIEDYDFSFVPTEEDELAY